MLNIAINDATKEGGSKLRAVAEALIEKAMSGDVAAIKEIADRLDGKVPQVVVGDGEHDPVSVIAEIRRTIVRPMPMQE
jgi:hypothetical protein